MSSKKKIITSLLICFTIFYSLIFSAEALFEKESAVNKFYSTDRKLLCISYRGDVTGYPENSLEGVKSALKTGADFVSVNIDKTVDGVYFLCEDESLGNICNAPYESLSQMNSSEAEKYSLYDIYGKLTKYKLTSLEELLKKTDSEDGIILDVRPDDKDAVYDVLLKHEATGRIILRVRESASRLTDWALSKAVKPYVIAVYSGNIIFSTVSAVNNITKSNLPAVQYESKNYFNVAYGNFFVNRYLTTESARAIAATYSPDVCGQRGDSADGWNELIGKGYSVIETNNIEGFVAYRNEAERLGKEIAELTEKAFNFDIANYSEVSVTNLNKARLYGETLTNGTVFSLEEAQQAYSKLVFALGDMKISTGEVDTRGALNITAGKIIAAVLVGAALLSGQIYVYKMRKTTKEKKEN